MVTVGGGVTVTVTAPVAGTEQPGVPPVATLTKVNVVDVVNVDEIVALPLASSTMVWLPLPVLYVTVAFGVPVKVIVAFCPEQIVTFPEMAAVGGGNTVMVTEPVAGALQLGVPDVAMPTSVKVVLAVYVPVMVAVPAAFKTMVWLPLPLL